MLEKIIKIDNKYEFLIRLSDEKELTFYRITRNFNFIDFDYEYDIILDGHGATPMGVFRKLIREIEGIVAGEKFIWFAPANPQRGRIFKKLIENHTKKQNYTFQDADGLIFILKNAK